MSISDTLGMNFTGPIKTGSAGFPIDALRWTIAKVSRGEHVVFKLVSVDNASVLVEEECYAIGWSDHHLKCYLTTHGEFVRLPPLQYSQYPLMRVL